MGDAAHFGFGQTQESTVVGGRDGDWQRFDATAMCALTHFTPTAGRVCRLTRSILGVVAS
jgi:hypothetical protein